MDLPELRRWCRLGDELIATGPSVSALNAEPRPSWTSAEFVDVRPGRFVREVIALLVAIASAGFAEEHPELVAFAGSSGRRTLPRRYNAYLSLYRGPRERIVGYSAQLDQRSRREVELVEFARPPFSYVLSLSGEAGIETTNISEFAELGPDEICIVELDLLNGFGHTPLPADFRTLAAVERDRAAERRAA